MQDKIACYATHGRLKFVFYCKAVEGGFKVTRRYKNGNERSIGRLYKTQIGCMQMARHRNACHRERYGSALLGGALSQGQ
jgi:hypothetical protein